MLQKQITNKLFYKKWPYKVSCSVEGIYLLRSYNYDYSRMSSETNIMRRYTGRPNINFNRLNNFCLIANKFIKDNSIKKRIEHNSITFYLLTVDQYKSVIDELKEFVYLITEPLNENELHQLENNYILCDQLPHKKYKFKITFKDMPLNVRKNLIDWAEKYNNDEIYIIPSTKIHFKGIKYKYGNHYFYLKDKKMSSFVMLAASGYIRSVDEYVTREMA